jgi:hypothetical protein
MSHDDFAFEPVRGLPALLPAGERLLWQGSPRWRSLAVRAYHVRKAAVYFLALILWRIGVGLYNSQSASTVAISCAFLLLLGGIAIGVLSLLAYLTARETVYSITSRRILIRHGVAVPMTMNIPFTVIEAVGLGNFSDGTGDLAIQVTGEQRVGYLITWPHLRPGHVTRPQPSFRALPDARQAAAILGEALKADAGVATVRVEQPDAAPTTAGVRPRAAAAA